MNARWLFTGIGLLALAAGTALWLFSRPPSQTDSQPSQISPSALFAASFSDAQGRPQALGQFQGRLVILNFWATWCAPCREEMPAFNRVQSRWKDRGVQFVGVSAEEPEKVARFARELGINYPLWTGGGDVSELSRRLGNRLGVLPHTVIIGPDGHILESRVGPYTERDLEQRLVAFAPKRS